MCDNCFNTEIKSFPDETTWTSFDLALTQKLGQGKMKAIKFVPDGKRDKDDGEYIYECLVCGERWKLKDPDNAFRGYFLKLSTLDNVKVKLTAKQKLISVMLVILFFVIIRLVYWIVVH
jgi:hypothetical protein